MNINFFLINQVIRVRIDQQSFSILSTPIFFFKFLANQKSLTGKDGPCRTTQDKGVFLFFHILNEILLNIEILKQFKVGNH